MHERWQIFKKKRLKFMRPADKKYYIQQAKSKQVFGSTRRWNNLFAIR